MEQRHGDELDLVPEPAVVGPVLWYMHTAGHDAVLDVTIAGKPVGKSRPRVVRGRGGGIHTVTPDATIAWEHAAELRFKDAWSRDPLDRDGVEIVVVVEAVHARTKDLLPGKRKTVPVGRLPCRKKPDLDNVAKIALDALVLARVLEDDCAVSSVVAEKFYAALDEGPSVRVRVFALEEAPWSS